MSLKSELEKEVSIMMLVRKLLENFERTYNEFNRENFYKILQKWRKYLKTIGNKAVCVNSEGVLLLELKKGISKKDQLWECRHVDELRLVL